MGVLVGAYMQQKRFPLYCADGTITSGGTAQLVLPQVPSRSLLKIQNLSNGPLWFEFGSARATATLTSGAVSSFTITNAGFNFTKPPVVKLFGGGKAGNGSYLGLGQPGGEAPVSTLGLGVPALAYATLSGGAVNAIVLEQHHGYTGGIGYVCAPYVFMMNSDLDPNGCAVPSATSGMLLTAQSAPYILDGTSCHTDAISVYGATTGQAFLCRWMQ